jgi:hypothetical protein
MHTYLSKPEVFMPKPKMFIPAIWVVIFVFWIELLSVQYALWSRAYAYESNGGDSDSLSFQEEAVFQQITENGPALVHQRGISYNKFFCTQEVPKLLNPFVVWSNHLADAVYTTTSNAVDGYVFAGTWQNPPKVAQLFARDGGGTPEWMYSGNEFYIDAGDKAFTLAAVDYYSTGVNVIKWTGPGSGTPDWTNNLIGYSGTTYGPVAVSDDGSTIAVLLSYSSMTHLLLFGSDSPTPIADYATSGFPRIVRINSDGRFTIFRAGTDILVYDRDSLALRDQIATGFSSSALDISGNGDLIAYGWTSLVVLQWNGSDYQVLWSWRPSGYYLSACAISSDGTTIVSGWDELSSTSAKVAAHLVGSSTPLWVYDYTRSSGVYQEDISDIETTDDGNYCIVGSWGDADNLNPEVHIFRRNSIPPLYYTVDMPGSVYSVDISGNGAYATACGKHVHANELGRGGDIVMIQLQETFIRGDANGDGVIDISDVVYLLNYLFVHGPAPVPLEAGDATCDGVVDASDVVYLIKYLFVNGPPPSC